MSHDDVDVTVARQIELEERAHHIRLQMLQNAGFQASLARGIADDAADRMISLEELAQQLDLD